MVEGGFDTIVKLWKASANNLAKVIGAGRGPKVLDALKASVGGATAMKMLIASNLLPRGVGERKLKLLFEIEADPRVWTAQKFDNVPGWGLASIDELLRSLPAALEWGKFREHLIVSSASSASSSSSSSSASSSSSSSSLPNPVSNGKSVVFTGVRNKELEHTLKAQGWEISPSVTKKTTVVIVADTFQGEESGKTKKATEYGVRIMRISDFSSSM